MTTETTRLKIGNVRYGDLEKLLIHQWTVQAHPFSRQIARQQQLYRSQEEEVCAGVSEG